MEGGAGLLRSNRTAGRVENPIAGIGIAQSWQLDSRPNTYDRKILDFDAVIVFRTNPVHSTRIAGILDNFCGYHRGAAFWTYVRMSFAFVSHTRTSCLGYLLFLCHILGFLSYDCVQHKNCAIYRSRTTQSTHFRLKNTGFQTIRTISPVRANSKYASITFIERDCRASRYSRI